MNPVHYPYVPKGWLKMRIFTFGIAFHFFVAINSSHFKFGMWLEHSKSKPTDDKLSLKWAWPCQVTHFKLLVPLRYLWIGLSWRLQIRCATVHVDHSKSQPSDDKLSLQGAWSLSRYLFNFLENKR